MKSPVGWLGVALLTVAGAMAAWLESLFVPYYVGDALVPVTIAFALATNWYLPRLARTLVPRTLAAVLPFLAWLAVIFLLSASGTAEGDVILPGGGAVEYIGYGVMFGGAIAGTISIVTSAPLPARDRQPASGSSR